MNYKSNESITPEQIHNQKRYLYGALIDCLYKHDEGYELLDARMQSLENQISGLSSLFGNPPQILTILSCIRDARIHPEQFRKNVLDAANLVDAIPEVTANV